MSPRSKILIISLIVAIIIISSSAILLFGKNKEEPTLENAPDFALFDIDGNEKKLSNLTDRAVILEFMHINCTSCLDSEKNISTIYTKFKREIYVLSIDVEPADTVDAIDQYKILNGFSFMNWSFSKDEAQSDGNFTHQLYNVNVTDNISHIYIIDQKGRIAFEKVGTITSAELEDKLESALVVRKAPDFTLTDIDGVSITLGDLEGKIVVLDFMFIDCPSCSIAEKNLIEIYPEFENDIHIISIDSVSSDTDSKLKDHRTNAGIMFENWTLARDAIQQEGSFVYQQYNVNEYVTIYIIDKKGYKTFHVVGAPSTDELRREINEALAGAEPQPVEQMSKYLLAIVAGTATFFSPCAFPMLPGYMAYYLGLQTSKTVEQKRKPYFRAILGGLTGGVGIIIVYVIIGVILLLPGEFLKSYIPLLGPVMGIVLIIAGILMLVNIDYNKLVNPFRALASKIKGKKVINKGNADQQNPDPEDAKKRGYYTKLFRYGVGFGAAASACVAPLFFVLVTTASAASITGTFWDGIIVLLLYALVVIGLMIAVTLILTIFGQKAARKMSQYTNVIKKGSAVVLIFVGIYLIAYYIMAFVI